MIFPPHSRVRVVVSVGKGRYFPTDGEAQLCCLATFQGTTLETPPVPHTPTPTWDTSLTWSISAETLSKLRKERAPFKLSVVCRIPGVPDATVGFVLLDLRRAALKRADPTYVALQSKGYEHDKPELLCGINVELESTAEDDEGAGRAGGGEREDNGAVEVGALGSDMEVAGMRVHLREHDGVYVVNSGGAPFVFSLTVGGTHSLAAFEPVAQQLAGSLDGPFYFYYSFLGNDVMTEVFDSLAAPVFAIERASIRLELPASMSLQLLSALSPLEVYLCAGETAIAVAHIPIDRLGGAASELAIEEAFPLSPVAHGGHLAPPHAGAAVYVVTSFTPGTRAPPPPASLLEWQAQAAVAQAEASLRCWRLGIDLRCVKDLDYPAASLFVRYSYPELGSAAPFATHPVVDYVRGNGMAEVILPNAFCAYEFVASEAFLRTTLGDAPLHIELWHRDRYVKDILLGVATVHLDSVMNAEATLGAVSVAGTGGEPTLLQTFDAFVVVTSLGSDAGDLPTRVGEIRVILSLENMGGAPPGLPSLDSRAGVGPGLVADGPTVTTTTRRTATAVSSVAPTAHAAAPNPNPQSASDPNPQSAPDPDPRAAPEYMAAWELEMWKQEQEAVFKAKLESREAAHLALLQAKFKEKEKLRIQVHERKRAEYAKLESQMRKALREVQERERRLVAGEQALERRTAALQDEYDRRVDELNEKSRRFREGINAKHRDVLGQLKRARRDADDAKADVKRLTRKLDAAAETIRKLQADVARSPTLQMEAQLEGLAAKLDAADADKVHLNKAKKHYRDQWVKALKEIARLQDEATANLVAGASSQRAAAQSDALAEARDHVTRLVEEQQRRMDEELAQIKLASAAREHTLMAKLEKQELDAIKNDLQKMMDSAAERKSDAAASTEPASDTGPGAAAAAAAGAAAADNHVLLDRDSLLNDLERLTDERAALIRSGLYSADDAVIRQMDAGLADLQAKLAATPY